ncbi:hypothetical protein M2451_003892 [Dysgonomonas sp. PFB1-18]|uniref:hypothetical protein n=1 Tax=unclassified Dysgonomonas TaxID=2630389 RepID=UPI00247398F6|nr:MULTISPECIES: hypothetical protein [unclassified Dysgonomonas]MDH6311064.1 hypothetical protein [Dysgonomonas sp. PF1-14]MDH6340996.1 hypothetical protein [Dysgonomonas sp. PF1-16]MDH6382551.1 hypothetical protein [Dysgonomonas sp. PFB1-18]MDH6399915.1 hypothetical protein [Dysgonomonas sp. PF1-23]
MKTLLSIFLQISTSGDIKSSLNEILSKYGIPLVAFIIVISAVYGVISNLDKIMDSDGRGTRKEGILNVLYILGGVVLAIVVIGIIMQLVGGISLSI